jgi:hypothetical protein
LLAAEEFLDPARETYAIQPLGVVRLSPNDEIRLGAHRIVSRRFAQCSESDRQSFYAAIRRPQSEGEPGKALLATATILVLAQSVWLGEHGALKIEDPHSADGDFLCRAGRGPEGKNGGGCQGSHLC